MAYLHMWMNQSNSTRRLRSIVGLEALETRALLAGLVNLPDGLIQLPNNFDHAQPAEVGQIRAQSIATQATATHGSPTTLFSVESEEYLDFADPIWSANRNWVSDAKSPIEDAQDSTKYNDAGKEDDGLSNGSDIKHNDNLTPGAPATTTDEAPPPTNSPPAITPSFVSIIATSPANNQLWEPPKSAANSAAPAPQLPSQASASFRYFNQSLPRGRGGEPNLSSEPLISAAVQETFVAFSLSGSSERPRDATAHEATHKPSKPAFRRPVPNTAHQDMVQLSPRAPHAHTDIVHRAKAAIAHASEIVRAADAGYALMRASTGGNDRIADQAQAQTDALAASVVKHPSTNNLNAPHTRSNGLQLGFFSLVSMLLSFRTSATLELNPDAKPFEPPPKVARKKKQTHPAAR